ncbi:hypothetical protein [Paludibaculum fermentans]|uniref:hypothetical protein n=1 Tax=Paludibaculum fermentans TaxID=1473598 RepID=UPI003EBA6C52
MASIVDQINDLTAKRQALLDQLITMLRDEVSALNNLGITYELVEVTGATARRRKRADAGTIRWATSITRITNSAKRIKLTKTQALDTVKAALGKLGREKGVEVPPEALAAAEKTVTEVYSKK